MFESLIDGKIFREWVSPAMLKAYQWQVETENPTPEVTGDGEGSEANSTLLLRLSQVASTVDSEGREASDFFDTGGAAGMSPEAIRRLPKLEVFSMSTGEIVREGTTCAVCLQVRERNRPVKSN